MFVLGHTTHIQTGVADIDKDAGSSVDVEGCDVKIANCVPMCARHLMIRTGHGGSPCREKRGN